LYPQTALSCAEPRQMT